MLRFIIRRQYKDAVEGWVEDSFETVDLDVPELERILSGGGSGKGYDVRTLAGVEVIASSVDDSEWVSVEDRVPPTTGNYMCTIATDDGCVVGELYFNEKKQWIHEGEPTFCKSYYFEPTHWKAMPKPMRG